MAIHERLDLGTVEERARTALRTFGVPGVAIGIVRGAQSYVAGFGVTSIEEPAPITPDTLFRVASITKVVTATAIMRLVDRGELELDAPVQRYIADLALDTPAATHQLTLRHLMTHTTGWPASQTQVDHSTEALQRVVAGLSAAPRMLPIGESWSYGNLGIAIAGRLIEIATGKVFDAAIRDLVLDPLGMDRTVFFAEEALSYETAAPHVTDGSTPTVLRRRGLRGHPSPLPAAGLFSTARDLIRFAQFHLGDGTSARGERLMSRASLVLMRAAHERSGAMGIGWFRERSGRRGEVAHTGVAPGYVSELALLPDAQFAVAVLTNASPPLDRLHTYRVMGLLDSGGPLGLVEWAAAEYGDISGSDDPESALEGRELAAYAGRYSGWDEVDVRVTGARLSLQLRADDPGAPPPCAASIHSSDRIRLLDGPGKGVRGQFLRGPGGAITGLRLPVLVLHRRP